MKTFFIFSLAICASSANAYFETQKASAPSTEMNGIKSNQFGEFTTLWHLVTVRYRQDTGEMRFTYANEAAWTTLRGLNPEYPDGAALGKIALKTEQDPSFPSSRIPVGGKRMQFMVKDKKRYADTDGWGYALFDSNGNLFSDDPKSTTAGCVACHRIVPEFGFVFSRPAFLSTSLLQVDKGAQSTQLAKSSPFIEKTDRLIPKAIAKRAVGKYKQFYSLEGALKSNAFSGTLDEVIPLLVTQVNKTSSPVFLYIDEKNFSLVTPKSSVKCGTGTSGKKIFISYNGRLVRESEICE